MGLKAPRGYGWLTDPKRAAYNRFYYRRTHPASLGCALLIVVPLVLALVAAMPVVLIAIPIAFVALLAHVATGNGPKSSASHQLRSWPTPDPETAQRVHALILKLDGESRETVEETISALQEIGVNACDALPVLWKLARSNIWDIRLRAIVAIEQITPDPDEAAVAHAEFSNLFIPDAEQQPD